MLSPAVSRESQKERFVNEIAPLYFRIRQDQRIRGSDGFSKSSHFAFAIGSEDSMRKGGLITGEPEMDVRLQEVMESMAVLDVGSTSLLELPSWKLLGIP